MSDKEAARANLIEAIKNGDVLQDAVGRYVDALALEAAETELEQTGDDGDGLDDWGDYDDDEMIKCLVCGGSGQDRYDLLDCSECDGTGYQYPV